MTWSRRRILAAGGALAGVSAAGLLAGTARSRETAANRAAVAGQDGEYRVVAPKRIALFNLHTDERLDIEYSRDGGHVPAALSAIEALLRDFRTGERHPIDPGLMDYLVQVADSAGVCTNGARALHGIVCTSRDAPLMCVCPVSIARILPHTPWA